MIATQVLNKAEGAWHARLAPVYQPIVDLQTGNVAGFEALARFETEHALLLPETMLARFDRDDLLAHFVKMVEQSLALVREPWWPGPGAFVSVNVEPGLVLTDGFCDLLEHLLDVGGAGPGQLAIELLECERVDDLGRMVDVLTRLGKAGVRIALDDLGSGYSSLRSLRELPIDTVKLDRSFVAGLRLRPKNLQFAFMLSGLARSLGKRLVVEGVETADTLEALALIGVELVQGYAIADPMAPRAMGTWLAEYKPVADHRTPRSLLGAYACHLVTVEALRLSGGQCRLVDMREGRVQRFLAGSNLQESCCGRAHRRFCQAVDRNDADRAAWEAASQEFRNALEQALIA